MDLHFEPIKAGVPFLRPHTRQVGLLTGPERLPSQGERCPARVHLDLGRSPLTSPQLRLGDCSGRTLPFAAQTGPFPQRIKALLQALRKDVTLLKGTLLSLGNESHGPHSNFISMEPVTSGGFRILGLGQRSAHGCSGWDSTAVSKDLF